jgi:hypothetical protein
VPNTFQVFVRFAFLKAIKNRQFRHVLLDRQKYFSICVGKENFRKPLPFDTQKYFGICVGKQFLKTTFLTEIWFSFSFVSLLIFPLPPTPSEVPAKPKIRHQSRCSGKLQLAGSWASKLELAATRFVARIVSSPSLVAAGRCFWRVAGFGRIIGGAGCLNEVLCESEIDA